MSSNGAHRKRRLFTPARITLTVFVFSLFALIGSSCNTTDEKSPTTPTAPKAGQVRQNAPAPTLAALPPEVLNSSLQSASGNPIKLSEYNGKVLLVNLWATWCGPCRNEIPELVKFYDEYKDKGFEVVGLSTEEPEASGPLVKQFVQAFKINYPVGWANRDVAVALMQGRDSIPQSFIISRDGRILKRFIGFSPVSTPPQMKQAIEDALKG
jgi:glutathione peroxidase-family protein